MQRPESPLPKPAAAAAQSKPKAVMKAVDGNEATANIAYALSDVTFIYPITPSTPMGEAVDQWANDGRVNLHGNVLQVGRHYCVFRKQLGPTTARVMQVLPCCSSISTIPFKGHSVHVSCPNRQRLLLQLTRHAAPVTWTSLG